MDQKAFVSPFAAGGLLGGHMSWVRAVSLSPHFGGLLKNVAGETQTRGWITITM